MPFSRFVDTKKVTRFLDLLKQRYFVTVGRAPIPGTGGKTMFAISGEDVKMCKDAYERFLADNEAKIRALHKIMTPPERMEAKKQFDEWIRVEQEKRKIERDLAEVACAVEAAAKEWGL